MIKSMTGFGFGEYHDEACKINVEIKSVNHRYNDMAIHMPKWLHPLEDEIRKMISSSLIRGKIDVFIAYARLSGGHKRVVCDKELAAAYFHSLNEIADFLHISRAGSVHEIAKYPEVFILEEDAPEVERIRRPLAKAIEEAVGRLSDMRSREGQNIYADLTRRVNHLENYADAIKRRAPEVSREYCEKLLAKVKGLLEGENIDEDRVLQETVLFAEKIDFTEEIVRLGSHFDQFKAALRVAGEAVGRKLDFIVQEMNRETNTIASKANDAAIAGYIVDIKSEIEKIREQVQNIE